MIEPLDRIGEEHPDISLDDVRTAWGSAFACLPRRNGRPFEYVAVGMDGKGRLLEMVGRLNKSGDWVVWHALTPPTKKTLKELGIRR